MKHGYFISILIILLFFIGCSSENTTQPSPESLAQPEKSAVSSIPSVSEPELEESLEVAIEEVEKPIENQQSYIDSVVADTVSKFATSDMGDYEKAKAAFDYIIESTHLLEPVGLDLWRIREDGSAKLSFVENRSLSVMLYGIGMCEDYAAAYTLLLRGMGIEAEYVPGLTYSAAGTGLVDHSWTVAKIDGTWYHFDVQLEDNISRRDTTRYKYFMRSDNIMFGSHRWGQNLIDSRLLTADQNEDIRQNYLLEPCPSDYPTPPTRRFTSAPMPNVQAIKADIEAEFDNYKDLHGELPPLELNIIPPLFGLIGYGPPDE